MEKFNQIIADLLGPVSGRSREEIEAVIESPQGTQNGDRAVPVFRWAKDGKVTPAALAAEWSKKLKSRLLPKEIAKIEAASGYINFFFQRTFLASEVLNDIHGAKGRYGFVGHAAPPVAVIEFSSPNIAKPFSIGHLRSTNIGASLSRIFEARGWRVLRINHLGDWGTQFGKLISAYRRWGNADLLKEDPIRKLFKLYVRWHEEEISDPTLIEEARDWFARLEAGDTEAKELWEWFRELTLRELRELYQELSVEFDHYWGESFYTDKIDGLLATLGKKGIASESEGATVVDLEKHGLPTCVLKKTDDSSLYLTRDIAAAIVRKEHFNFNHMIYVVGAPQKLHFQQLFKILELMGHSWAAECEHVPFGHISFGDEAMSTRKGNVVFLSEVLDRATELARKVVEEKNPELADKETVARSVGLAAILFADLSAKRIKDVKFSWEEILSFDGETGPYLQYTLVRTKSLLRKYDREPEPHVGPGLLESDEEAAVIRTLSQFPGVLQKAEREREPFYVAQYAIQLVKTFNRFYTAHRVLDAPDGIKKARVFLVACTSDVLETGMKLLGIPLLDRM